MIITSELTGKRYETVDDCIEDEKRFKEAQAAKELAEKARQAKIDAAYKKAIDAFREYQKALGVSDDDAQVFGLDFITDLIFGKDK